MFMMCKTIYISFSGCCVYVDLRNPVRQSHRTANTHSHKWNEQRVESDFPCWKCAHIGDRHTKPIIFVANGYSISFFFDSLPFAHTQFALFIQWLSLGLLPFAAACLAHTEPLCQLTIAFTEKKQQKRSKKNPMKTFLSAPNVNGSLLHISHTLSHSRTCNQLWLRETNDLEQLVMTPLMTIEQLKCNYGRFFSLASVSKRFCSHSIVDIIGFGCDFVSVIMICTIQSPLVSAEYVASLCLRSFAFLLKKKTSKRKKDCLCSIQINWKTFQSTKNAGSN